ncbi:hypothetical protein BS78_07G230000 [Paspalum vaginatum]|nr:hypothetical protein BS78_07G230000 [Paspalum vaginatum]
MPPSPRKRKRTPPPPSPFPPSIIHIEPSSSDWEEREADKDGRPYYYNTKTKESTWEKPTWIVIRGLI